MSERVIAVAAEFQSHRRTSDLQGALEELAELCRSAGLQVVKTLPVRQKAPSSTYYLGKGKAWEIRKMAEEFAVGVVCFESDLSASQQRNLEEVIQKKTIDRTQLILEIFARAAKSTEGKLQVELAQLKYLLPRLTGEGIFLSRLGGGIGTRGPGEQKLEMDRRLIRERLGRLGRELLLLGKRRGANLKRKKEKDWPIIALVGYTNAGKSSLFNALTHSSAPVKEKMFSTLDTATRLLLLPGNQKALLVDTVGFVRDLPHHLIESFKATLEEAVQADILLHVADADRRDLESANETVKKVLSDLDVEARKTVMVYNKMDLVPQSFKDSRTSSGDAEGAFVSAKTGEGIPALLNLLSAYLSKSQNVRQFFIPKEKLGLAHYLYESGHVLKRQDESKGSTFLVKISPKLETFFLSKIKL